MVENKLKNMSMTFKGEYNFFAFKIIDYNYNKFTIG